MKNKLADIDYLESLTNETERVIQSINKQVLQVIALRLKKIETTPIDKLQVLSDYGIKDIRAIDKIVKKGTKQAEKEIKKVIEEITNTSIEFAQNYYELGAINKQYNVENAKMIALAIARQTQGEFINLANTFGFKISGRYSPLNSVYFQIIDKAIINVASGTKPFQKVVRDTTRELVNGGLKGISFETGRVVNALGHIRMNILQGAIQTSQEVLNVIGTEVGTDGYEISAHSLCAVDHQEIQGKQYSSIAYERLQAELKRPIGTLNCRHIAFPIILGVSKPAYSNQELRELRKKSNEVISFKDKRYTRYQATQEQRLQERKIRDLKYKIEIYKDLNDEIAYKKLRRTLKYKVSEYKEFSKAFQIPIRNENLRI